MMIVFDHVTKRYAKAAEPALRDLCMEIKPGVLYGLLGPNGAGKTTAIRLLTGVLAPTEGRVLVGGHDMAKDPVAAKRLIGFVPDGQEMYDRLTGIEYLNFMADMYGVDAGKRKVHAEKYLALFDLEKAAGEQIRSYSRGMRQKLTVIGALMHNPKVWVLDEPMVGLDPRASHILKEEMRARADAGATVFFSTHVLEVAERLCDEVGIIHQGSLIARGTLDELRQGAADKGLEKLFLELTDTEGAEA